LPLETATYTPDLNVANPAHTDGLSQADSHIRLLKSTIKNTFPNFTDVALASTQAQLDAAVAVASGASAGAFAAGTAALPGLYVAGSPSTGFFSPAANQVALSLNGTQALLMGGTALVTTLSIASTAGIAAATIGSVGAYSGGTGQLVPVGSTMIWWTNVCPTGYIWCNGANISRTTYPQLFALWGTAYGAGDGSTTFGIPNLCETVPVGQNGMGATGIDRNLAGGNVTLANLWGTLGSLAGSAFNVLTTGNLPPYTPAGNIANGAITVNNSNVVNSAGGNLCYGGGSIGNSATVSVSQAASSWTGTAQGGTSTPLNNVQPSTTVAYIIRAA